MKRNGIMLIERHFNILGRRKTNAEDSLIIKKYENRNTAVKYISAMIMF